MPDPVQSFFGDRYDLACVIDEAGRSIVREIYAE
jgi:hypothetical protein